MMAGTLGATASGATTVTSVTGNDNDKESA